MWLVAGALWLCGSTACAATDAQAVLATAQAAAVEGARPFGDPALGKVTWSKVDGAQLKLKLGLPVEAASGLVKLLATNADVSLAASTWGFNATEVAIPFKGRTLHGAELSLELALGGKISVADKVTALGFGIVRRVFTSEAAKFKAGGLLTKQIAFSGGGGCHLEGRARNIAALVTGLKRLAGELPVETGTGAGTAPPPVKVGLKEVKVTRMVAETADGVECIGFAVDGVFAPVKAGAPPQGFEALEVAYGVPKMIADLHAPYANPLVGEILSTTSEPGLAVIRFTSCFMVWPTLIKNLEADTRLEPNALGMSFAQETRMQKYKDDKGRERWYAVLRCQLVLSSRSMTDLPSPPKRGDYTRAIETLDRIFTSTGSEFVPPKPYLGPNETPPPPPPPELVIPLRPMMRDVRFTLGHLEMTALFHDKAELTAAVAELGKTAFSEITVEGEREEPYRDAKIVAATIKARVSK